VPILHSIPTTTSLEELSVPPSPMLQRLLHREVGYFQYQISRARTLFDCVVVNGASTKTGSARALRQPDRRDLAQFLFFEVAASWEHFARECFLLAVRNHYNASAQKIEFIVGHPDSGLKRVFGWAIPKQLMDRATNLIGINSEIARLNRVPMGQRICERLNWAHAIRNNIAHDGTSSAYRDILRQMNVPAAERKGVGSGRLLLEYPAPVTIGDRWFDRLLWAYEAVANRWSTHLYE
jgi:hypothetical protein